VLPYPATRRDDLVETIHGAQVADPYRWLEDAKDPNVAAWTAAEDTLARDFLSKLPGRDKLAERFKELFYIESVATPRHHGTRWFFARRDAGKEKFIVYWREGKTGAGAGAGGGEKVLLDPTTWSADGSAALGVWSVSQDGKHVAYTVKENNSDEATLYVIEVATGKKSAVDVIPGARYASPAWNASGSGFYYTWIPPKDSVPTAERPGYAEIRYHALGADPAKDKTIHEKTGNAKTFLDVDISHSGRWLFVTTQHGWTRSDLEFMDLHAAKPVWKPLVTGQDAVYSVDVDHDRFFVRTNEGAPKYRVFVVDPAHAERASWTELIAERKDATLESLGIVGHHLLLAYLKDVVSYVEIRTLDGKPVRTIDVPTLGAIGGFSGNSDDDLAYYSFQSFTYPTEIFETQVSTGKTTSFYKLKVPVDPSKYVVEQRFATSKDQTKIPFFLVHAKDLVPDGKRPTILTGYGGFQVAETPYFSSAIYPWLERGGVWVVANLRGGSEYGEDWHKAGMLHNKQNVFDDFFAVGDELVRLGVTNAGKLAALGGSNGGLLVGAAITQRPDLFRVALCAVPLLDMVRYHLFGSGKTWVEEYGSSENAADFAALVSYSPYHHVTKGTRYPSTLILSADSDDRVDPLHARKFAAMLQWAAGPRPVLLRVEKHSGHGGADLVKTNVERLADEYAFALDQMKD
jgi:prolyl oligopeptidase